MKREYEVEFFGWSTHFDRLDLKQWIREQSEKGFVLDRITGVMGGAGEEAYGEYLVVMYREVEQKGEGQ